MSAADVIAHLNHASVYLRMAVQESKGTEYEADARHALRECRAAVRGVKRNSVERDRHGRPYAQEG